MTNQTRQLITDAAAMFSPTFGLRAFHGNTFRISTAHSYHDGTNVMLYTEILKGGIWLSFAKGTVSELLAEVVTNPEPEPNPDPGPQSCEHCQKMGHDTDSLTCEEARQAAAIEQRILAPYIDRWKAQLAAYGQPTKEIL